MCPHTEKWRGCWYKDVTFLQLEMDLSVLLEALRQELWRLSSREEAAAAAERERDEALFREVAAVRQAGQAAAEGFRMEDVALLLEMVLHYFGTSRAVAAMVLALYAMEGQGGLCGRAVALLLAILLDLGMVALVALPRMGRRGRQWAGRLIGGDGGQQRAAAAGDVELGIGDGGAVGGVGGAPQPGGGVANWVLSWLWGR
jgi:hypothetical protein